MAIGNVLRLGAAGVVGYGLYQVGKEAYENKDEIKQKAKEFKNDVKQKAVDFNEFQKENRQKIQKYGLRNVLGISTTAKPEENK